MSRSVTAAVLSALVFPGAGQIYLKRLARGCIFLLPALAALPVLFNQLMARALPLAQQIASGNLALDPVAIVAQLERQDQPGSPLLAISSTLLLVCWVASIVDAFLIARLPSPGAAAAPRR